MDEIKHKIQKAEMFYKSGNFINAKKLAAEIMTEKVATDAQKQSAQALLNSMGTDTVAIIGFGVTLCVLIFLVVKYLL